MRSVARSLLTIAVPAHAALMLLSRSASCLHRVLAAHQGPNSLGSGKTRRSSLTALVPAAAASTSGMLEAEEDRYDGIIVKPDSLPADPGTFKAALEESLQAWTKQGKRGIWLRVPIALSQLIPVAVEPGFTFHHAEKDYVMMTKWLPQTENTLPPNASHQVGVGAVVVNARQEMLVVQEANGPLRGQGFWKMPTGLVQEGEDLVDAVEREVLEETGVRAKFSGLIAIRQAHGFMFGKSDMFFCCGLTLQEGSDTGQQLKACEREIAAVKWMPVQEYTSQAYFQKLPAAYHTMMERCVAWAQGRYRGMTGRVFEGSASRPRQDLLLWGDLDDGPAAAAAAAAAAGDCAAKVARVADNGACDNGSVVEVGEGRTAVVAANGLLN
ncbi:NUDIX hydrolase domain-like protein [Scenedesmus sp. NREL 46B-D3]|nr:NUDIX hydrolase domain-like protein [Scenedesmus sp. NREL 46B-D3]